MTLRRLLANSIDTSGPMPAASPIVTPTTGFVLMVLLVADIRVARTDTNPVCAKRAITRLGLACLARNRQCDGSSQPLTALTAQKAPTYRQCGRMGGQRCLLEQRTASITDRPACPRGMSRE